MSSQTVTGSGGTRNRMVMLAAGSDTTKTVLLTTLESVTQPVAFPRVPAASLSNSGTAAAPISGGDYAKQTRGRYIGFKMSDFIAGIASTVLKSGGAEFANSSNRHTTNKSTTVRALGVNTWDYKTGAITKGGTAGNSNSVGADHATTLPEISYMAGGANPTSTDLATPNSF